MHLPYGSIIYFISINGPTELPKIKLMYRNKKYIFFIIRQNYIFNFFYKLNDFNQK